MTFVLAILCIAEGAFMLAKPTLVWKWQHWFSVQKGEPRKAYLIALRIAGAVVAALGAAVLILELTK